MLTDVLWTKIRRKLSREPEYAESGKVRRRVAGEAVAVSRQGDASRFQDLYQQYYRPIVAFFVRLGFSRDEARDYAQDTFVRVYRSMETYRGDGAWAFLQTTARRIALNEIRSRATQRRNAKVSPLDELLAQTESVSKDPWTGSLPRSPEAELVEREEDIRRRRRLKQAIESLPESLRLCFLLRLRGCSYREIMADLSLSMDAVKSRLNEARNRLREMLGEEPEGMAWPREDPERGDHDQED